MEKKLTAAAVARLRPGKERQQYLDAGCPGLYLLVQPSGVKSWVMRFRRLNGKQGKLTLGRVDLRARGSPDEPAVGTPLTLAAARRLAFSIQHERATGKDVFATARRAKLVRTARAENTFDRGALDFIEQHARPKNRTWRDQAKILGLRPDGLELIAGGLSDRWRNRPVGEISGDDIHALVAEVRASGVPGWRGVSTGQMSSRALVMYAVLSKMFGWLAENRRLGLNPCTGVAHPATQPPRERVLRDTEVATFWRAARAERKEFAAVLMLLLLTGQRRGEVRGLRRSELSDDGDTWTIPGERTKNRRVHVVPLSKLARDIVAGVGTKSEIMFTTNGRAPVVIGSKIKRRLDAAMKTTPWRLHDLRRTAATGMAELGVQPHIIEAVLNHVSGHRAGVAGTYNRAAYAAEKKAALEKWAAHVKRITHHGQ